MERKKLKKLASLRSGALKQEQREEQEQAIATSCTFCLLSVDPHELRHSRDESVACLFPKQIGKALTR